MMTPDEAAFTKPQTNFNLTVRELIDQGYLTDYKILARPPSNLKLKLVSNSMRDHAVLSDKISIPGQDRSVESVWIIWLVGLGAWWL